MSMRLKARDSALSVVLLSSRSPTMAVRAAEQFLAEARASHPATKRATVALWRPNPTTIGGEGSPAESVVLASRSNDIGSVQEEYFAALAAAPTSDGTSGNRPVEARRLTAVQHALLMTRDLGSVQEASSAATAASSDEIPAPTGAELLAQLRAVELSLSRYVGTDQQVPSCAPRTQPEHRGLIHHPEPAANAAARTGRKFNELDHPRSPAHPES